VMASQFWNSKRTINATTAFGMTFGKIVNFVISTPGAILAVPWLGKFGMESLLNNLPLRSGWQSGEVRLFVYLASLE